MRNELIQKRRNQFGDVWTPLYYKLAETAKNNKGGAIPYNPLAFVLWERLLSIPANDIKSMIDYGIQIGLFELGASHEFVKFKR